MKIVKTSLLLLFALSVNSQSRNFSDHNGFLTLGTEKNRTASVAMGDIDGDKDIRILI